MKVILTVLLLSLGGQGVASERPFTELLKLMGKGAGSTAMKKLIENMVDDAYDRLDEKKVKGTDRPAKEMVLDKSSVSDESKRRFVREYTVACRGMTVCNTSPHKIVQVSGVTGTWKCESGAESCSYTGYASTPHGQDKYIKNRDHRYLCLLSDESCSAGTPVVVQRYVPGKKTQLNFWANDTGDAGIGSLKVTLLVQED